MPTILHISDLHFGPPYMAEVGDALATTATTLAPDLIVASGDFTQRAKRQQFADARVFLDRLPDVPIICTPGNHDVPLYRIWERLSRPHELYCKHIEHHLDHALHFEGVSVVSLDSTAPSRSISNGRIKLGQLEFCERAFSESPPGNLRILTAHHHFAPAPDYERDQVMPKARRALDRLVGMRVDLILGGHLHRAYIGNSLDVYRGADPEHGIIIVQSGTSTSRRGRGREREKNTMNLLYLDRNMIDITHFLYFDEPHRFEPVSRHRFPRPGHPFVEIGDR